MHKREYLVTDSAIDYCDLGIPFERFDLSVNDISDLGWQVEEAKTAEAFRSLRLDAAFGGHDDFCVRSTPHCPSSRFHVEFALPTSRTEFGRVQVWVIEVERDCLGSLQS